MLTVTAVLPVGMGSLTDDLVENELRPVLQRVYSGSEVLPKAFDARMSQMFSLRMGIAYRLFREEVDWEKALGESQSQLRELTKQIEADGNLLLAENFGFASEIAIDVSRAVLEASRSEGVSRDASVFLKLNYDDFLSLLRIEALSPLTRQNVLEITRAATFLDFAIISVALYVEEALEIPRDKLAELSVCLRDWAQLYGALARELGIWRQEPACVRVGSRLQEDDARNEQGLANSGLQDYLKGILEEEQSA
ncbi:MAG: hypothetical protein HY671_08505 [Chloroflexi bacterium]|nr:hypothetical protein [Chloroflexota bacterium]